MRITEERTRDEFMVDLRDVPDTACYMVLAESQDIQVDLAPDRE